MQRNSITHVAQSHMHVLSQPHCLNLSTMPVFQAMPVHCPACPLMAGTSHMSHNENVVSAAYAKYVQVEVVERRRKRTVGARIEQLGWGGSLQFSTCLF